MEQLANMDALESTTKDTSTIPGVTPPNVEPLPTPPTSIDSSIPGVTPPPPQSIPTPPVSSTPPPPGQPQITPPSIPGVVPPTTPPPRHFFTTNAENSKCIMNLCITYG